MLQKLAVCTALLAAAFSASAQVRRAPPVGTVYVKSATDCFDKRDESGAPVCVMGSTGGGYDSTLPYRKVTTMALPYGKYVISAKVLYTSGGDRPLNPWVVVECVLEDDAHSVMDYASDNWSTHVQSHGSSTPIEVHMGLSGGTTVVLSGVYDQKAAAPASVSISCRVQGQCGINNGDGTISWSAPIRDIRFHSAKIVATAAASITAN